MRTTTQRKAKSRTVFFTLLSLLWMVVLIFRLIDLQVVNVALYQSRSLEQSKNRREVLPKRGSIYDRNGVILGRSLPYPSICYRPIPDESVSSQMSRLKRLQSLLRLSGSEWNNIKDRIQKEKGFIYIKRKVQPALAGRVMALEIPGVDTVEETKRFYPHGTLAAHVIGRVDMDDNGISGIEYSYNSLLRGISGEQYIFRDALRRAFQYENLVEPVQGQDLTLTLDETVQYIAEKEIEAAVRDTGSLWGTVIVSHPATGEILAMANYPSFDPNQQVDSTRNNAIHYTYAPGSTFKIITASAALENNLVKLTDTFDCSEGSIRVPGKLVRDHKVFGVLTFPEVIINSSNVGIIQVAARIGPDLLNRTIRAYGFYSKTGIDLPGEERGLMQPFDRWTDISVPSLSMGYEINVTPLQMLGALNVIANDGVAVCPRIVADKDTWLKERTPEETRVRRVLSVSTARTIAGILRDTVALGTGTTAAIPGYVIAGKTGTAQKYDRRKKVWLTNSHIASFMGYVKTDTPVFSAIVVLDDPKGPYYGSQVAAPVFKRIARQVLRYYRIQPSGLDQDRIIKPAAETGGNGP